MADRFNVNAMIQPGLTYSPETFQESLFLPLQYRDREDRLSNEMSDMIVKMSNINVGDNEKAKEYYNQFVNKTNEEIDNIQKNITENGVLNPNTINNFRNLKTRYSVESSANGRLGQLAKLASEVQQQRGLRLERNLTEGYDAETGLTQYQNQVDQMYNGINWDRFQNDPNYSIADFQASYAPKNITVDDIVKDMSSSIGSITNSYKGNTLTPVYDNTTGLWTLHDQNQGYMNSSNEPQLEALNQSIRLEIDNLDSPLMQAELYRLGKTKENVTPQELQDIKGRLSQKLTYNIMAMTTSINSVDNTQSQQVINTITAAPTSTSGSGNDDDADGSAKLDIGEAGYRNVDLNDAFTKNLDDVASGKAYETLEAMGNSGNYNGMTEKEFSQINNKVISLERIISKELKEIDTDDNVRKEVFDKAYSKKLTRFGDNLLDEKYRNRFKDLTTSNNTILKSNIQGMSTYKLPGTNFTVKQAFEDKNKYNTILNNTIKYKEEFDKYKSLDSQVLSKTPYKTEIGMFYDNSNIGESSIAVNNKGQYIFGTSISAMYDKTSNTRDFGKFNVIRGEKNVIDTLAKLNNTDPETMKNYLKASTNKNVYQKFSGIIKSSIVEQNNERLNKDGLKYDSDTFYLGQGEKSLKLGEQINKTLNTNLGSNLFNLAINSNTMLMKDGNYSLVNDDFSGEKGVAELMATFPNAKFSFQNIVSNGSSSNAEIGFKIDYKKKGEDKTAFMYVPYTGDSKSTAVESILTELENNLNPYDAARIKSIKDNTKTNYLVVDSQKTAVSGASKNQKNLLVRAGEQVLDFDIRNNTNYKNVTSFFTNADKANLYSTPDGYYGLVTKTGNGQAVAMNVGQFIQKESLLNSIATNQMGTTGYIDNSENYTSPQKQTMLISEVYNLVKMSQKGLIKIPTVNPETDTYFNQFLTLMEQPGGGLNLSVQDKFNAAKVIYDNMKTKQILHTNKLKLLY